MAKFRQMEDLSLVSTGDLWDELSKRHKAAVMAVLCEPKVKGGTPMCLTYYRGHFDELAVVLQMAARNISEHGRDGPGEVEGAGR